MDSYFSLSGRYNRKKYASIAIPLVVLEFIIMSYVMMFIREGSIENGTIVSYCIIVLFNALLAPAVVKRLHDIGWPGGIYWALFLPYVNVIVGLILLLKKRANGESHHRLDLFESVLDPTAEPVHILGETQTQHEAQRLTPGHTQANVQGALVEGQEVGIAKPTPCKQGDALPSKMSSAITQALELREIELRLEKVSRMDLRQLQTDIDRLSEIGDHSLLPLLFTRFDGRDVDGREYDEYSKVLYRYLSMFDFELVLDYIRPLFLDTSLKGQLARLYLLSINYIPAQDCLGMLSIENVRIRRTALKILSVNPTNVGSLDPNLLRQLANALMDAIPKNPPEFMLDEKGRWICAWCLKRLNAKQNRTCYGCTRDWAGIHPDDASPSEVAKRLETIAAAIESYNSDS